MNVYEIITERIIAKLAAAAVPWRKPWHGGEAGMPRSLQSGQPYRGINVFLLTASGYSSPYWLTMRQANRRGGRVRKGEHGTPVVFWKWREITERDDSGEDTIRRVPLLRYYKVFNVAQCEDIEVPETERAPGCDFAPITRCEDILDGIPCPPDIATGFDRAAYQPAYDRIVMPAPSAFESAEAWYATLFHELGHATGHARRLARAAVMDFDAFGSHAYSKEELVAEMSAAFLCGHAGIDAATIDNSAAYIDGWLRVLRGDSRLVVHAAAQAQKAADYILDRWPAPAPDQGQPATEHTQPARAHARAGA